MRHVVLIALLVQRLRQDGEYLRGTEGFQSGTDTAARDRVYTRGGWGEKKKKKKKVYEYCG